MIGDAEFVTGDPTGIIFYRGYPRWVFFTGVEASGALSRDVLKRLYLAAFRRGNFIFIRIIPKSEQYCNSIGGKYRQSPSDWSIIFTIMNIDHVSPGRPNPVVSVSCYRERARMGCWLQRRATK